MTTYLALPAIPGQSACIAKQTDGGNTVPLLNVIESQDNFPVDAALRNMAALLNRSSPKQLEPLHHLGLHMHYQKLGHAVVMRPRTTGTSETGLMLAATVQGREEGVMDLISKGLMESACSAIEVDNAPSAPRPDQTRPPSGPRF